MKGIVFSELLEMVENTFGFDVLDSVIEKANLPNNGIYVSGGTYPHQELVQIVVALHQETNTPVPDLLIAYGKYLFGRLIGLYPALAEGKSDPLEFISGVDSIIHVEVRKLYPDAELPVFYVVSYEGNTLIMDYESSRHMEDFGKGLMLGCADHYKRNLKISYEPIKEVSEHRVRFTIILED